MMLSKNVLRDALPIVGAMLLIAAATGTPSNGQETDSDPAVRHVLGTTSLQFQGMTFKSVQLGRTFEEINSVTPLRPTDDHEPVAHWKTSKGDALFLFDGEKRLISYSRLYDGGPDEYSAELTTLFGKTDKKLKERTSVNEFTESAKSVSTIDYTFPKTLVRVIFAKRATAIGTGIRTAETTQVVMLDRAWLTRTLQKNAKDKRRIVQWLLDATDVLKSGKIEITAFGKLEGATVQETPDSLIRVRYLDTESEERNRGRVNTTSKLRSEFASIGFFKDSERLRSPLLPLVNFNFDRYSPHEAGTVYGQPMTKTSPGTEARNAVATARFGDLVVDLNSFLLQETFPPVTDTVSLVRPRNGIAYYEWRATNGWKVQCGFNDSVTLIKIQEKGL